MKSTVKQFIAITLTAVLILAVLVSGASGYSDCAVRCMRHMAKVNPHAAAESTHLRMPDCCSGRLPIPCEMNTAPEVKIPACSIMRHHSTVSVSVFGTGMTSDTADADPVRTSKVGLRLFQGNFYKDPPIYLHTLSLLC